MNAKTSKLRTSKPATVSAKGDATTANVAGSAQRIAAIKNWGNAASGEQSALVACFVAIARTGETSADEVAQGRGWYGQNAEGDRVPSSSCAPYASTFNRAAKVATVIGIGPAVDVIERAAKGANGRAKEAVYDALGAVLVGAKRDGVKAGNCTKAQGAKLVKQALATSADKAADRKSGKVAKRKPQAASKAGAMAEAGAKLAASKSFAEGAATLRLISNTLHGAATPEGMDAQARTFLAALSAACEAGAPFLRKVVKS